MFVSVIVPVFNASLFLESCVKSICVHNEVGEIILVEDGSTDNSLELCYNLQKIDSRICIYRHEKGKNLGAAKSRNLGIEKARFPYISFLDSDDEYYPNRFENSILLLESNCGISACYGKVLMKYTNSNNSKLMGVPNGMNHKSLFSYLLNGGYFHTNSITLRKTVLEKLGGFNQNCWPHEDVELWIRLAYYSKIESLDTEDPIAEYKIHGNNLSKIGNWKSRFNLWNTVFNIFFLKKISMIDRKNILKQLVKVQYQRLLQS